MIDTALRWRISIPSWPSSSRRVRHRGARICSEGADPETGPSEVRAPAQSEPLSAVRSCTGLRVAVREVVGRAGPGAPGGQTPPGRDRVAPSRLRCPASLVTLESARLARTAGCREREREHSVRLHNSQARRPRNRRNVVRPPRCRGHRPRSRSSARSGRFPREMRRQRSPHLEVETRPPQLLARPFSLGPVSRSRRSTLDRVALSMCVNANPSSPGMSLRSERTVSFRANERR